MKKIFTLLILMTLLASCAKDPTPSSSEGSDSTNSSEISSSLDGGSSEINSGSEGGSSSQGGGSSSDGGSNSGSETEDVVLRDISEIKNLAATFDKTKVNKWGVYTSTVKAEITAQLLTLQDYTTTKEGYNGRYKAFVANETGFITVNIPYDKNMVDFKQDQQVYTFSGVVGLYNDEIEIDTGIIKPIRQVGVSLDYDYKEFATPETSIASLRESLFKPEFKVNVKGIGWKQAINRMDLEYVAKVDSAIALFSDGENVIEVHGHDKVNGGLTVGQTYTVYGRPGLFNFRPELEYIGFVSKDQSVKLSFVNVPTITAADIYKYGFEIEKDTDYLLAKNKQYGGIVNNVYYFEGYVNYYAKDGKYHLLLEDSFREDPRSSEAAAYAAKSLSLKNDDSRNLNDRGFDSSPFYDFYNSGEKFGVFLTPHEFSKVAWDVFALSAPFAIE